MDDHQENRHLRRSIFRQVLFNHSALVLALLVAATAAAAFWHLNTLQDQLVSALAEQGAVQVSETLEEVRTLYTSKVVETVRKHGIEVTHDYQKKDNAIPLPATLTIELGDRIGNHGSGLKVRLYSDFPFPWRKDGGPHDSFEREALNALRRDPTQSVTKVEQYQGRPVIRYAVADRMRPGCVSCHNTHPASPKTDWKEGDVRGVLEVIRPISTFVATAREGQRTAFGLMSAIAVLGIAGVGLVFGRQRRDAKEIMQNAARLSAMDEASPLGTFVTDTQGRCLRMNQAYLKITGYSAQAMMGKAWSTAVHPEDRERVLNQWQDALGKDQTFATDCRLLRADTSVIWVSCKAAAMRSNGQLLGYVGTLEDISERKNVERMKNEFISTVSHELRTPLTSIMGSLGLLAGRAIGELPRGAVTLVDIARKNSERLVRLINDILDIEKIESGSTQFDLQPQELQPLVEQAIAGNRAYAEQFRVTFKFDGQCADARARVDADRLAQVLTNLMGNAAKFSPAGGTVELRLAREGGMVRFAVTDHGPGIPESFRDKVFGKFSQADSSDTRQKGGTGLGLSISKAIIEAMGGSIGFVTEEGQGTTFYVDLPEWVEPAPAAVLATATIAPDRLPDRPKVLVCEDDRDVAALLCMMLGQAGYNALPAYDAAAARTLLADGGFVAMTLDIRLPDLDGRAFLRELRADPATRELPIVVVSANLRKHPRANEGDGLGVVDWIAKPIDQMRLLSALRRGVGGNEQRKGRVLHVEDDEDLRHVVASLCAEIADFESAASFHQAAHLLSSRRYDLIILDVELPDRSGWDLLSLIDEQVPRPPVLVFSGAEPSAEQSGRIAAALVKSHVSNPELLEAIRTLTQKT